MDIEEKYQSAVQRITALRGQHNDQSLLDAFDDAESLLGRVTDKAVGIAQVQTAGARIASAVSCLGLQLPIPDMPGAMAGFIDVIKDLAGGAVFDGWMDYLDNPDLSDLAKLKTLASDFLAGLDGLDSIFIEFSALQDNIKAAVSTVSALIGCTDPVTGMGLGQQFSTIGGVLDEVNPEFKAGLDAVAAAEKHFSDPREILDDAKGRVTGMLDLDSKVTRIKDQFQQARGWLS